MNELVRLGTFPRAKLPNRDTISKTESSYFKALIELHIDHLTHQRNDAVDSVDDCRRKFVSRNLFHQLSREGKLTPLSKMMDRSGCGVITSDPEMCF